MPGPNFLKKNPFTPTVKKTLKLHNCILSVLVIGNRVLERQS